MKLREYGSSESYTREATLFWVSCKKNVVEGNSRLTNRAEFVISGEVHQILHALDNFRYLPLTMAHYHKTSNTKVRVTRAAKEYL